MTFLEILVPGKGIKGSYIGFFFFVPPGYYYYVVLFDRLGSFGSFEKDTLPDLELSLVTGLVAFPAGVILDPLAFAVTSPSGSFFDSNSLL